MQSDQRARGYCLKAALLSMVVLPFLLCVGCGAQTLVIIDPYIAELYPSTFSRLRVTVQQGLGARRADIWHVELEELLSEALPTRLMENAYHAVISTPAYASSIIPLARNYPEISFWHLALPSLSDTVATPNQHILTFDNADAMEQIAEYLDAEFPAFEDEFLFLLNPRNDHDYAAGERLEEALIARQLKFDIDRMDPVNTDRLQIYIENINAGQYKVVGLFLKRHNYAIYNSIDIDSTVIITEHIGDQDQYRALPSIVASIEYDYRQGIREILSAVRSTQEGAISEKIMLNADLIFYK